MQIQTYTNVLGYPIKLYKKKKKKKKKGKKVCNGEKK
jgi:hypothetical protein